MIGHRLHGHGPVKVIGCHGWFGSSADWRAMEPALDAERFSFAWIDQRGYGLSIDQAGAFTVDEVASDVLALAGSLGWEHFHLVGHSMGGKVIQRVAGRAPQRVRSMVAVTPVPASGVPLDDGTYAVFAAAGGDQAVALQLVSYSVSDRHPPAWIRQLVAGSRACTRREAFDAYLPSWAREDFGDDVRGLPVPVLVLVGQHDPALRPALMEDTFLRLYPNARLAEIPNAGHYPMWETPIDLAGRLQSFVEDAEATDAEAPAAGP